MVDLALPVPDALDSGGGVCPHPPESNGIGCVLDLRSGTQHESHGQQQSFSSGAGDDRSTARRRSHRGCPLRFLWSRDTRSSCPV